MKNYTKLDYENYKSIDCICNEESYYLGKILAECYEFLDEEVRDTTLQAVLDYKIYLTNQIKTAKSEYTVCVEILSADFRDLTHSEIAMKFGYRITKNPRTGTIWQTLKAFESDIAKGCLRSDVDYSGEYFSIVYELSRKSLIIQSMMWRSADSKLVLDTKKSISDRLKVFDQFFESSENLPVFMQRFRSSQWNPTDMIELCYSDQIYIPWIKTWTGYTGKNYFEWTRQEQIWWDPVNEGNEQYINSQIEMLSTLDQTELYWLLDLCYYSICSWVWRFMNLDIKISEYNKNIEINLSRLKKISGYYCNEYLIEVINKLSSLSGNYSNIEEIENIIGWKIFLD